VLLVCKCLTSVDSLADVVATFALSQDVSDYLWWVQILLLMLFLPLPILRQYVIMLDKSRFPCWCCWCLCFPPESEQSCLTTADSVADVVGAFFASPQDVSNYVWKVQILLLMLLLLLPCLSQ